MKNRIWLLVLVVVLLLAGCTPENPANVANFPTAYPVQGRNEAGTLGIPLEDSMTGALVTVEIEHSQLHQGTMFTVTNVTAVGGSGNESWQILTPSGTLMLHMEFNIESEAEAEFELYEGSSVSANGTAITPINRNRLSIVSPETKLWATPTIKTLGTLIDVHHWGSGKGVGGGETSMNEWLLKPSTIYIVRLTNLTVSSNIISFEADWYKHPY